MANKTTAYQNSQGVIFHQRAPVSSSDLNEVQTVINNRFQATYNDMMFKWSINTSSVITLTEVNIKNKIVSKLNGVSFTLPNTLNRIHVFTRLIDIVTPTDTVYLYGLRSNPQTTITGANTIGANNIIPDALGQQVSNRVLAEWTFVVTTVSANTPSLSGWNYEGYLTIGKTNIAGTGESHSTSSDQLFVDYIIKDTATLTNVDNVARQYSWSGKNTVLDLTGSYNIYQYNDISAKWEVIGNAARPDLLIFTGDILTKPKTVDPSKRVPGYATIYNLDGSLTSKVQELAGGNNTSSLSTSGGVMQGPINMNGNAITNLLPTPVGDNDAAPKKWVLTQISNNKYTLPTASATVLGGIKIGNRLSIDANGVLNATYTYTLPTASATVLGGIKIGTGLSISNGVVSFASDANSATATKLKTARTILTNLGSTSSASFDGSANVTPGVSGVLPIARGGTGASTASAARTALGIVNPVTMVGATSSKAGTAGYVPAPSTSDTSKFLRGDGTWSTPSGGATLTEAGTPYRPVYINSNGQVQPIWDTTGSNFTMGLVVPDDVYVNNLGISIGHEVPTSGNNLGSIHIGDNMIKIDRAKAATAGIYIGSRAGYGISEFDYEKGTSTTSGRNICIGQYVAQGTDNIDYITSYRANTFVGDGIFSLIVLNSSSSLSYNTIIGEDAAVSPYGPFHDNVIIGNGAGNAGSQEQSVIIGVDAAYYMQSTNNIIIGYKAGYGNSIPSAITSNNVIIGTNLPEVTTSNTVQLGNSSITSLRCQVTSISSLSDLRVKEDIKLADTSICLQDVLRLPVSRFKYKDFTGTHLDTHVTGFMADDYEKVFPKGVTRTNEEYPLLDEDGNNIYKEVKKTKQDKYGKHEEIEQVPQTFTLKDVKSITPTEALPTLWGAVQELSKLLDQYKSENTELVNRVKQLEMKG